jgi:hypothetical protein
MIDKDDCGATGGMKIGRGNLSSRRKPAPAPLCPPQIPHDETRARTPGRRGGKPATNRLSYGAAIQCVTGCYDWVVRLLFLYSVDTLSVTQYMGSSDCLFSE